MGDDATGLSKTAVVPDPEFADDEPGDEPRWFVETEPNVWTVTWPDGWVRTLAASLTAVVDRLRDPSREVWIVDGAGDRYEHAELAVVATDSTESLMTAVAEATLRSDELGAVAGSAGNLALIAATAVSLDELVSDESGAEPRDDVALMAARRFFDRLHDRVARALNGEVRRRPDGRFVVEWRAGDRAMIESLSQEFDALIATDDPAVARLFPPAYVDDDERADGYAAMTRDELIERRRASAGVLLAGMSAESVDTEGLLTMMRALNDLRLVVGTQLDVSEDARPRIRASDPDAARWFAYERLNRLLSYIIVALDEAT